MTRRRSLRDRFDPELRRRLLIAVAFLAIVAFMIAKCERQEPIETGPEEEEKIIVREPVVAGQFYPAAKEELQSMIKAQLSLAEKKETDNVRGLVAPHAGYTYSGPVAAYAYRAVQGKPFDTVIVMGPSHHFKFSRVSIPPVTHYKTPLGTVEISPKVEELKKNVLFVSVPEAHQKEHSVEVQVPFLQEVLGSGFKIIPLVLGNVDPEMLAWALEDIIDEKTLVVASSDLSHYQEYSVAQTMDAICNEAIPRLDFEKVTFCEACGILPVMTLMHIAKDFGWKGLLLDYRNSGDTAGSKESVVGYSSIAFFGGIPEEKGQLSDEDKAFLLSMARQTLDMHVREGKKLGVNPEKLPASLKEEKGCFVTLNKNRNLRGCIGHIFPREALYQCVIDNAINAASNDARFSPVEEEELSDIEVEVSVLTVPEELSFDGPDDLLDRLRPSKDGVVLQAGFHQSTYLPQVWEQIPEKDAFLSSLCIKGGSNSECWKDSSTKISTYQAGVFSE